MKKGLLLLVLCFAVLGSGCVPAYQQKELDTYRPSVPQMPPGYKEDHSSARYEDSHVLVYINATHNRINRVDGFILGIRNKTNDEILIPWENIYFLERGQAKGGFMTEGVTYSKRQEPRQPILVLPKSVTTLTIWPNDYVFNNSVVGWAHEAMGNGEYGVYINAKVAGKNKKIKLIIKIQGLEQ